MSDQDRLDKLAPMVEAQRKIAHKLHDEWSSACKVLHALEREQSTVFIKVAAPQENE